MRTDTERLDWLEMMANQPGGLLLHDGTETGRTGLGLRPGTLSRGLRAAIDDAMRGSAIEEQAELPTESGGEVIDLMQAIKDALATTDPSSAR